MSKRKKGNGKTTDQIYKEVTDRIVGALEEGTVPWQRPWRVEGGSHMNLIRKRPYRGVNIFLLDLTAMINGYSQPWWLTFKQAKELGGNVKKGEKSTLVVFWKPIKVEAKDKANKPVKDKSGSPIFKTIPLLKYYPVFNVEQCEGFEQKIPKIEREEFEPIERAQQIVKEMPHAPPISHGGDSASYSPFADKVRLPRSDQFDTPAAYYTTAYHELAHSTGHESRLARVKDWSSFGSEPYGKEELVAEMAAAMLSSYAEIDIPTKDNSAAYIASWLKTIKGDPKLVVHAASKAQQASDYILGEWEAEEEKVNGD